MNLFNMCRLSNANTFRIYIVAAILFFPIKKAFSQDLPQGDPFQYNVTDKMFLPTPEQASLMKFIDIPVGNHTGVQGYSIPIYTIQGKDFSLPITLSYHGGGIKVDELSSSVGIGWGLNIGGISLSEEVRGERDLDQSIEKIDPVDIVNFNPVYGEEHSGGSPHYKLALRINGIQTSGPPGVPQAELQPDYFSYNLLNNSGRFMLDNNNKPHTIPKDDVGIFMTPPANTKQHIIDNKGITYYFSSYGQEHSPGLESTSFTPRIRYSYKVDEIVIPNSGNVNFEYYEVSYEYISSRSNTKKLNYPSLTGEIIQKSETKSTVTENLPKSVSYKNIKVNFIYKMNNGNFVGRLDVNQGGNSSISKRGAILEYIEVIDIANSTVPIKKYKLITDYFDTESNRLKLEAVQDIIQGTDYVFTYYGEEQGKFLPPRFSFKQDYWGMYNGKGNSTSIPQIYYDNRLIPGANKDPDIAYAKIGSLQKIKLPTGGFQEFEYELDEFRNSEFPDSYEFNAIHNFQQRSIQLIANDSHNVGTYYPIIADEDPSINVTDGFNFKVFFGYDGNPNGNLGDDIPVVNDYYYAQFVKNGNLIEPKIYGGEFTFPDSFFEDGSTYSMVVKKQGNPPSNQYPRFEVIWQHDYVTRPQNRNAGTLRVKSITLADANENPQIKRSYSYTDFDDSNHSGISSGFFTGTMPFPWAYITSVDSEFEGQITTNNYLHIPDNGLQNASTSFGKSVIYKKVTETYQSTLNTSDNYRKEYIFSVPENYNLVSPIPIQPPAHEDYLHGLLLEERLWNSQSQKVKVTKSHYNLGNELDFFFNQFSANYLVHSTQGQYSGSLSPSLAVANTGRDYWHTFDPFIFHFNIQGITSAWIKLLDTTTETYENGVMTTTQTQKYKYDDSNNELKNIHPIETITYNSRNEELKTEYVYGHPYKKDEPTITRQYEKNAPTYVKETTFQGGLPKHEFAKKAANSLDNALPSEDLMVTYDSYDANSNLTQYTTANGTPVSIIWGYNGQYPLAKVEGAYYNTLSSYISVLEPASNNGTLTPASFESLRNLSGALVTSYVYKPLLGVTSVTQPNGQTEYYSYDKAGRLDEVYIMEVVNGASVKRILKKSDYNYQP